MRQVLRARSKSTVARRISRRNSRRALRRRLNAERLEDRRLLAGGSAVTEYLFDNDNGNNDWTQAANWSLRLPDGTIENPNNSIPQTADSVRIPDGFIASYLAVFDGGGNLLNPIPPIDCLVVDPGGTLSISRGPMTINTSATIDGRLQMGIPSVHNTDLAKITGSGTVTVNGELDWRSGSIDNNTVIAEAGVVKLSALGNRSGSPSVASSPSVTGPILNHGLIEVIGPESLTATELDIFVGPARVYTGGVGEVHNQGELRIPGDVQWLSNGGVGLINLADGTITKSGTGSTFIGINFENDGTLDLQQGQFVIGDVPGGVDDGISSGEFQLGQDTNFGSFYSLTTDRGIQNRWLDGKQRVDSRRTQSNRWNL